jgi:PAS domain S-box-containing protein
MVMTRLPMPYTVVQVNKLWEDMTGYTAAEVVGNPLVVFSKYPKKDNKPLSEMMQEIRF